MNPPRPNTLCKFVLSSRAKKYAHEYPFKIGEHVLFLGEIPNMPGHCVIVSGSLKNGSGCPACDITYGWHTDNFVELTDDET